MKKTALVTHEECLQHVTPPGHPEQVARLEYILEALKDINLLRVSAPMAADDDILRIHPREHINYLQDSVPENGFKSLDGDTHISSGSLPAAYRAAGGVLRAVDLVLSGESKNAFVAVRPPGHHAETQKAMGFCLFGNIALGVKHALDFHRLKKVAVIGSGMRGKVGIASRVFLAAQKSNANVMMIAQGSSELNLAFVVKDNDCKAVVTSLHNEFKLNAIK